VIVTLYRANAEEDWQKISEAPPADKEKIKNKEYETRRVRHYKIGTVFDISQTSCPIEDYPKIFQKVGYNSEQHAQLFNALASYSNDMLNCPVIVKDIKSISTKGFYRPFENDTTISDRLKDTERLSVLTHETGHAILHNVASLENTEKTPDLIEFEADAVSIMAHNYFGLEISDSRRSHLANVYSKVLEQIDSGIITSSVEDILQNICDIYESHIEGIQHYIKRELNSEYQNNTVYYTISYDADNNTHNLFGINAQNNIIKYGEFPTAAAAVSEIDKLSNKKKNEVLPTYEALQEKVLSAVDKPIIEKPTDLKAPYVHVLWSDSAALKDNSFYSIKDAQQIFKMLDEKVLSSKSSGNYEKTKFKIVFADGNIYSGEQHFGDGDGGIIDHIQKFWENDINFIEYPLEKREQMQKGAFEIVKKLWDAYDDNYLEFYSKKLEMAQARNDQAQIKNINDQIINTLTNKRNRAIEFEETGIAHQLPMITTSDVDLPVDVEM
ncbi:MAG: hypothetical protein K2H01_06920, partial [Ruminococcus sp.]|nr:hypothetical protein [Ruminococcus sp.]